MSKKSSPKKQKASKREKGKISAPSAERQEKRAETQERKPKR